MLVSPEPFPVGHDVHFIVLCRVGSLGQQTTYNQHFYDCIPLTLFDILHFSTFEGERYYQHTRKARLAREQAMQDAMDLDRHMESKERVSMIVDSKWTKRAIQFATQSARSSLARPAVQRRDPSKSSPVI